METENNLQRQSLETWYFKKTGKCLNLDDPQTFNEKVQWLKIYNSIPIKTLLADKYLVRKWVEDKIGSQYLIKLLGVYDKFDDIDFSTLPNRFVIKANHGSGWNIIVKDKNKFDIDEAKQKVDKWMATNYAYVCAYEMQYRDIPPKIIIEEYMEDTNGQLQDYKVLCFDGKPELIWVDRDRSTDHKRNLYDLEWNLLPYKINTYKNFPSPQKPICLKRLIELAAKLSQGFPFVRVDFYIVGDSVFFGEMTFSSSSGTEVISPKSFEKYLCSKITLPQLAYDIDTKKYYKLPKTPLFQRILKRIKYNNFLSIIRDQNKIILIILGLKIAFKYKKKNS